jgi:Do/DeqQ family serine protease
MKIRLFVGALLLATGFLTGIALTGLPRAQPPGPSDIAERPPSPQVAAAPSQTPEPSAGSAAPASLPAAQAPQTTGAVTAGPDFTAVAARAVGAVTNISSTQIVRRPNSPFFNDPFFSDLFGDDEFFGGGSRPEQSLGSGVIVSSDGYMVTNKHVIGDDVQKVTVVLPDKRQLPATIVGVDDYTDLAVLKVDARGLPVLPWGDSSKLKVAEWVLAIGNPFQLSQTVTLGIVSALGRDIGGLSPYGVFIQTDAAINPGNSGGALVNARGEVVGINTAIYSKTGGYQGLGFAVPSNIARQVVDDIIRYGEVRRGSIGYLTVRPVTPYIARQLGAPSAEGLLVESMRRDSQAYQAGVRPGDIITTFNGAPVSDTQHLQRAIADAKIGATVRIGIVRDGRTQEVTVPVGKAGARRQD